MTMQPVYGRKARIIMWVEDGHGLNTADHDKGEIHIAHLFRRYYDWKHKDLTYSYRRRGYFIDHEAFMSTLKQWNKESKDFQFHVWWAGTRYNDSGIYVVDEVDDLKPYHTSPSP